MSLKDHLQKEGREGQGSSRPNPGQPYRSACSATVSQRNWPSHKGHWCIIQGLCGPLIYRSKFDNSAGDYTLCREFYASPSSQFDITDRNNFRGQMPCGRDANVPLSPSKYARRCKVFWTCLSNKYDGDIERYNNHYCNVECVYYYAIIYINPAWNLWTFQSTYNLACSRLIHCFYSNPVKTFDLLITKRLLEEFDESFTNSLPTLKSVWVKTAGK